MARRRRAADVESRPARRPAPVPPGADEEQELVDEADTRLIAARQTTGIVQRRAIADPNLPYEMIPFDSTRVREAGYRSDTEIVRVIFRDGTPWQYFEVSPQIWNGFKNAESPGRFIHHILNQYPYGRGDFV